MNLLIVSDLHLTSNPRDEYRWGLFPWLAKQIVEQSISYLLILGDVTEAKDYHSSRLVNRIVDSLLGLYRDTGLLGIYVLRGNHDGLDPRTAYFRFLGKYPSIQFVEIPFTTTIGGKDVLFLPHSTDPGTEWKNVDMHNVDYIFMHATITGAVSESGVALTGTPAGLLATARRAKIYSGDVHVPQKVGKVEYVGAPYPIRFGDRFEPRALLLTTGSVAASVKVPAPPAIKRRTLAVGAAGASLAALKAQGLGAGDQVKVRIRLAPSELGDWAKAKRATLDLCTKMGVEVHGVELDRETTTPAPNLPPTHEKESPEVVFTSWCSSNKVSKRTVSVGLTLLRG